MKLSGNEIVVVGGSLTEKRFDVSVWGLARLQSRKMMTRKMMTLAG